jgi:hypothetical protein
MASGYCSAGAIRAAQDVAHAPDCAIKGVGSAQKNRLAPTVLSTATSIHVGNKFGGVMRYAGPRMVWKHPVMSLRHWLDGFRKTPAI